jgi:hypothetical protein
MLVDSEIRNMADYPAFGEDRFQFDQLSFVENNRGRLLAKYLTSFRPSHSHAI